MMTASARHVVDVADMAISATPGDEIVTYALGSCLGIAIHDPVAGVGGMLHVMLPLSKIDRDKARARPCMFVDTGVPLLFKKAYAAGACKHRLTVKVAGGANMRGIVDGQFEIGKRNYTILKRLLWKNSILMEAEDVGGISPRTMHLDVATGRVWLSHGSRKWEL